MNPYVVAWQAFIYYYQILHRAWVMDDPKYEQNVIFVSCKKCTKTAMGVIIQKEGMSFTCDFCGTLVLFIKKGELDKLITGLESAAKEATTEQLS